jgi:hypothetical protein
MATTNYSWPNQIAPQQRANPWPNQTAPQQGFGSWPNLNVPQEHFSMTPTLVAPMAQSVQKPKPKGRRIVAWSLFVFAGGLSAGPPLADFADQGLEAGISWLATSAPSFLRPYLPKPLEEPTPPPHRPNVAGSVAAAPSAVERAQTTGVLAQPKPTAEIAARRPGTTAPVVVAIATPAAFERPATQAEPRRAHGTHRRVAATLAEAESPAPVATVRSAEHKPDEHHDPFDSDGHRTAEPAATERMAKTAAEPAPVRINPAKSGDPLDELMTGVAGGSKPRDRRNTSKEIDAMLKDVQKSEPAPPPKHAEPAPLPPLTAADIAKVMAGVKTRANACSKHFGQNGVADLKLTVGKDGKVTDVALRGKLADLPIAQCIAKAARGATFPPNAGLKFDYRIDVQ